MILRLADDSGKNLMRDWLQQNFMCSNLSSLFIKRRITQLAIITAINRIIDTSHCVGLNLKTDLPFGKFQ